MSKILVVDDEKDLEILIQRKFRKQIRDFIYEFYFAANAPQALDMIEQIPGIEIVLSDIKMPGMDGLTLLQKVNEKNNLIKTVIISAYGDISNIRIAMNRGAFDFITKPVDFDDLETTIEKTLQHIKQLKLTMEAIKENNILRMYVDDTVLNFMNSRRFESSLMDSESIEATVAFIDICRFTAITENESPATVVSLLNKFFDVIVKEIIKQEGYVDKFIGDAVMAVFKGKFHIDRAIDACLSIRNAVNQLPPIQSNIPFKPKVSIGINCGEMVSGNIGSESLKRLDYTVIGDTVNVAQRLQSIASPDQILISDAAYDKVKIAFECKPAGEFSLKHKEKPMHAFEVIE